MWTATLLSWQSDFSRHSGNQSYGWTLIVERGIGQSISLTSLRSSSVKVPHTDSVPQRDTTSQFLGYDKKNAWAIRTSFPDLTITPGALMLSPAFSLDAFPLQRFERFVVLVYNEGCSTAGVCETRLHVWSQA